MSFQAALHSDIVRAFAVIIAAALIFAAILLSVLGWICHRNVTQIWVIYRSWIVIIVVGFAGLIAGREAAIAGLGLLALLGFKEFSRATGLYRDWLMTGAVYVGIIACAITALIRDPFFGVLGWFRMFMALPVYAITMVLMVPILRNRAKGQLQSVSLAILGFIYIGWMFGHFAFLANSINPYGYLLYLTFAVSVSDIAAFTFGKLLGRHKLRSEISPNKTWEGAMGAVAVSLALPWALPFALPKLEPLQLVLTGIIVGVGGQLGDLVISYIKREVGIKDMGASLPGHGGVLDRLDSLIFAAPLFVHMLNYFYLLYPQR